jgi:biotin operon repressor
MTQTQQIKAALQSGAAITPIDALNQFGCFRLAARIDELRKEGMDIETVPQTRNGKRYAAYVLRGQASLPFEARA